MRTIWTGYAARVGEKKNIRKAQKKREHQENSDLGMWIILKCIFDKMGWYGLD
jgi:hypothetical protein